MLKGGAANFQLADEHRRLKTQIRSLQKKADESEWNQRIREEAVDKFD
jgi:hypothetical protein